MFFVEYCYKANVLWLFVLPESLHPSIAYWDWWLSELYLWSLCAPCCVNISPRCISHVAFFTVLC